MIQRFTQTTAGLRVPVFVLLLAMLPPAWSAENGGNWLDVVRQTPYWESRGVAANLATIRRWVLFGESFCDKEQRHLLLDRRWRFLGYIDNGASPRETLSRLNSTRSRLAEEERVEHWYPGDMGNTGYPFALSCHQPFVDMREAIARVLGGDAEYRVWGTWDGISVGAEETPVSLLELFRAVVDFRAAQGLFTFPESVIPTFLGKVIIESGARKEALSSAAARGIMQLSPEVLDDCRIPERFHLHRIAQVDCALRLMEQNHRNLQEPFNTRFGHLPQAKRLHLYDLLLNQAWVIGVGRTRELLMDEELGRAARYFAEHEENFSAQDVLVGMIYHNMGRRDLGPLSLYYVTDARLALATLCASASMQSDIWCDASQAQ